MIELFTVEMLSKELNIPSEVLYKTIHIDKIKCVHKSKSGKEYFLLSQFKII